MRAVSIAILLSVASLVPAQNPATTVVFRGRVLDDAGAPLVGAGVIGGDERSVLTVDCLQRPGVRAGDDGVFRLEVETAPEVLLIAAAGRLGLCVETSSLRQSDGVFDCGDLSLPSGKTQHGRVVDADGKPIAGARVIVQDAVGEGLAFPGDPDRKGRYAVFASTDVKGVFALAGVAGGMRLEVSAPGFATRSIQHVGASAATTIALTKSGFVAGRIVGRDGAPIVAKVTLYQIGHQRVVSIRVDDGGRFRATLPGSGAYRVSVDAPGFDPWQSEDLTMPAEDLEITLVPKQKQTRIVTVRAKDAATGEAIRAFRAGVVWSMGPGWPRLHRLLRDGGEVANADGAAALRFPVPPMPAQLTPSIGVRAPGYALGITSSDDDTVVALEREATLAGVVQDAASGRPLAGALVWTYPVLPTAGGVWADGSDMETEPDGAVRTGEDGSFRLIGLSSGEHNVHVRPSARPTAHERITLAAGEARQGVVLGVETGCTLVVELTGRAVPAAARIRLVPRMRSGWQNISAMVDPHLVFASAPGARAATFAGLPPNEYTVRLSLPARARCGPPIEVYLDQIELAKGELKRSFDISQHDAARIRGRVTVHGALAPDRLLVMSPGNAGLAPAGGLEAIRGWRSFVSPQGEFELLLPPGAHQLWVIDLETGLPLHAEDDPNVPSGETRRDLELRPAIVSVRAVADPGVRLAGSLLRVHPPSVIGPPTTIELPIDSERWDFFVLPGPMFLQAFGKRSAMGILPRPAPNELRVDLEAGKRCEVEIPVVGR